MRDLVTMLESESRRKPEVAKLLDRCLNLEISEAEIEGVEVPLPWYRTALKEALKRAKTKKELDEQMKQFDDVPMNMIDGVNSHMGITALYKGDQCWVLANRGFMVEVRYGDLLFFPKDGGAWLNQIYFDRPPQEFRSFTVVEEQTRHEYIDAYAVHLNSKNQTVNY